MVCYAVPLVGAILCHAWRKSGEKNDSQKNFWLNLLLGGGAIFGVVDHFWNGELFLFGDNLAMDLALGFAITAVIFGSWMLLCKTNAFSPQATKA